VARGGAPLGYGPRSLPRDRQDRLIEHAIAEGCASSVRQNLFQPGQVAVARLSEISYELTEATAKLDASGRRFAALEKQLGYIPVLRAMRAASKDLENCSNGG
jgi:hypothetical protein